MAEIKQRMTICSSCEDFHPLGQLCVCKPKAHFRVNKTQQVNSLPRFKAVKWNIVVPRDDGRCQRCKIKFGKITDAEECHHVYNQKDYKHLAYDPDNLIMLCVHCHNIFTYTPRWKDKLDFLWPNMEILQTKLITPTENIDMFLF